MKKLSHNRPEEGIEILKSSTKSTIFLVIASIAILGTFSIDIILLKVSVIMEGPPKFEGIYLNRLLLTALASFLFVSALLKMNTQDSGQIFPNASRVTSENWGVVTWSMKDSDKGDILTLTTKELVVWSVLLLSLFFLFLFLYNPRWFNKLCREDELVEMFSACFWFISCGFLIYTAITIRRNSNHTSLFYLVIPATLAFLFFFIGMEEISWFQRIFDIPTPQVLDSNIQGEINIHNLEGVGDIFENAFYFSAFIFLVLVPFLNEKTKLFDKYSVLSFFSPGRFVIFIGAIAMAYNYDMWNVPFMQLSFFITLFILFHYAWHMRAIDTSYLLPTLITVYVLTQVLFLKYGYRLIREFEVTEYKEFFIPLSFLVYSIDVLLRVKNQEKIQS